MKKTKDNIPYICTKCKRNCPFEIRMLVLDKSVNKGIPINLKSWCKLFEFRKGE